MEILTTQYNEVKDARAAMFTYCATMQPANLLRSVAEFNNRSIMYLLVHSANTYLHWLQFFVNQVPAIYFDENKVSSLDDMRDTYDQIDALVGSFLTEYKADYFVPISQKLRSKDKTITVTALKLFTHVVTHEFHHKGQIITMSRLLGYIPVDTDVIRT